MLNMELSDNNEQRLRRLMQAFLAENAKLNLSAYRTEEQCWAGNVLDSIAMGALSDERWAMSDGRTVVDIGIGGGFPLLPLAILFPDIHFTGIDATKKKIAAVQRIVNHLGLGNVTLVTGRAEELGRDITLRERFDVVLARGIAPLPTLLEFMSPFARPPQASGQASIGGQLLCWKSLHSQTEEVASLTAREKLCVRLTNRIRYELPDDWGKRQILVFEKIGELTSEFPRRVGVPKKEPL